jgi:hypothetical protein
MHRNNSGSLSLANLSGSFDGAMHVVIVDQGLTFGSSSLPCIPASGNIKARWNQRVDAGRAVPGRLGGRLKLFSPSLQGPENLRGNHNELSYDDR